jgi:hypothetical protein
VVVLVAGRARAVEGPLQLSASNEGPGHDRLWTPGHEGSCGLARAEHRKAD